MMNHWQIDGQFAIKQSCLVTLFGLFALLSYLLLPAVYYSHLTAAIFPATFEHIRAGPLAIGIYPENPPDPCHESNSCTICQAVSSFRDYGFFSLPQVHRLRYSGSDSRHHQPHSYHRLL